VSDDRPLFGESLFVPLLLVIPIVVLAIGAIWAVRARPSVVATLQRGESEGRAFAHVNKQTVSTCLDGAIATLDRLDQPIEPGAAAFFEACLSESGLPKIGGAKQSAPTRALLCSPGKRPQLPHGSAGRLGPYAGARDRRVTLNTSIDAISTAPVVRFRGLARLLALA